jgi:hypothetical protein
MYIPMYIPTLESTPKKQFCKFILTNKEALNSSYSFKLNIFQIMNISLLSLRFIRYVLYKRQSILCFVFYVSKTGLSYTSRRRDGLRRTEDRSSIVRVSETEAKERDSWTGLPDFS